MKQIFLFLTTLLFISSCLKKTDLDDPLVGPVISQAEMALKMTEGLGAFGFDEVKVGEGNILQVSQTIEETTVRKIEQQSLLVKAIETTSEGNKLYSFIQTYYDNIDPRNSFEAKQLPPIDGLYSLAQLEPMVVPPVFDFLYLATNGCNTPDASCHNLQTTNQSFILKEELADPSFCTDVKFCEIRTKVITFDRLEQMSGKRRKVNYTFMVAPQLPFLSRVLKYCRRFVVTTSQRDVLQETCYDTTYFQAGQ